MQKATEHLEARNVPGESYENALPSDIKLKEYDLENISEEVITRATKSIKAFIAATRIKIIIRYSIVCNPLVLFFK